MENLLEKLILSQSQEEFFAQLSNYFHKDMTYSSLYLLEEKEPLIKLYHLLFCAKVSSHYQDFMINGLLESAYLNEDDARQVFNFCKKDAKRFFQLAIIKGENISRIKSICEQFEKVMPNMIWTLDEQRGIVIFTFDHGPYASIELQEYLKELLESQKCTMYFSYPYDCLMDTRQFYDPVKLMADMDVSEEGTIKHYEDYYLKSLFMVINNKHMLYSLIHPNIQRIIRHDKNYKTPYYQTLKVYLKHKRQIGPTIEELKINRSTLFYRFNQIGKMLEKDFHDLDLFAYEFSIHIYEYLRRA